MIFIKICGIICEYNPLHAGHKYQLEQARALSGADKVICIMSGNFVQRGENAVFDKFSRAKAAIEAGADAVFELPTVFALQAAEYFAYGGVLIASALGCTHLCFGSECGDISVLEKIASQMTFSKEKINNGASYASANTDFTEQERANNMLGIEYLRAIKMLDSPIIPLTVKRDFNFLSASEIRKNLSNPQAHPISAKPLYFEALFPIIKYKLLSMPTDELSHICGVNEGLEHKIKAEILSSNSLNELILSVKSKRYTYSRISRILCCALLDITKEKLYFALNNTPKARLLAIKKESEVLLKTLNNFYISPLENKNQITEIDLKATEFYSIFSELIGNEDYTLGLIKAP